MMSTDEESNLLKAGTCVMNLLVFHIAFLKRFMLYLLGTKPQSINITSTSTGKRKAGRHI